MDMNNKVTTNGKGNALHLHHGDVIIDFDLKEEQPNASSIRDAVAENSKRLSDKYCCSTRDINKEEK